MKKTRNVFILVSALAVILAVGLSADAKDKKHAMKDANFQGEVLDMACYISHGAKGADHAACALKCAKDGQPIGLLTKDGKVFLLFADHDDNTAFNKTKDFAGKNVAISGMPFEKDGIKGITVHSVKGVE